MNTGVDGHHIAKIQYPKHSGNVVNEPNMKQRPDDSVESITTLTINQGLYL